MFSPFKKKPGWKEFRQQLESIPVKNESLAIIESDSSRTVYSVKLAYHGAMKYIAPVMKLRQEKKYSLDGLGLEVFNLFDGKRTVEDVIDVLIERYKLTFFESRNLLMHYVRMLVQRGMIVLAVRRE